ncbi:MAG: helix-turn-helix domain-containing protein [Planctomycetes bacterium]|nr:helix-turn-helix domain-containing protein [Planctomycetota bacterium]
MAPPIIGNSKIRINDFDHLVRLLSGWEGKIEQLSRGRFEGTLQVARGQELHAHFAKGNQAILVRGRERPGVVTIALVIPESATCRWQGKQIDAGCLVVRRGVVEVDHRTSKIAANLSITIAEERLSEIARLMTGSSPKPINWLAMQSPPDVFKRLEARVRQFIVSGSGSPSADVQEVRSIEQACLAAAAEAVFPMHDSSSFDLTLRSRTALVGRAEDLMRARLRIPTGEIDLCAALGASGRTLRLAFRERFGLGPMAYYQALRLHAVRAAFKKTEAPSQEIAVIANDFGFAHAGKFSGYYRRQFGELPSETISHGNRSRRVPVAI